MKRERKDVEEKGEGERDTKMRRKARVTEKKEGGGGMERRGKRKGDYMRQRMRKGRENKRWSEKES